MDYICIFSSYILICFRAAVRLIVEIVSQIWIMWNAVGDLIEAFPVGGIKNTSLTQKAKCHFIDIVMLTTC